MEGMNYVIDQSPWMVNGKPLVVQKWDPDVCFEKTEPCKLPIWVKHVNVPLEAWSVRGISAIASRLGKPIMMDKITAAMCHNGSGRAGFARILVEMEARKGIQDQIEIVYKDALNYTKTTKFVKVEYNWKPTLCVHCGVFGHNDKTCKAQSTKDKSQMVNDDSNNGTWKNGFTEVNRRKNFIKNFGGPSTSNVQYNQRKVTTKYVVKNKSNMNNEGDKENKGKEKRDKVNNEERQEIRTNERPPSLEKIWRVDADMVNKLKRSANKYAVLTTEDEEFENICYDDRITVDRFILKKQKPKEEEMANWTYDMKQYLKYRWEAVNRGDDESDDENEVLEVNDPAVSSLIAEEIQGGDTQLLN
ncbi:RNA-directed DNA polymerase, eukaryota, reverse transcriptase zinc-binding domain protein [Tanacetum coccineum]